MQHLKPEHILYLLFASCLNAACMGRPAASETVADPSDDETADSISRQPTLSELTLPDTAYASASAITFVVESEDSVETPLQYYDDPYEQQSGVLTFRKNLLRNADFGGRVVGTPDTIEIAWQVKTKYDTTRTRFGKWGGGSGWTGQPLFVRWTSEQMQAFRQVSAYLTEDFSNEEIIVGSLCGEAYFINFNNGRLSRQPLDLHNVVKGTPSLDPQWPNLYVGQGVPKGEPLGCQAFDLLSHERPFFFADPKAWRGWNAFDSSPIVAGGYLFWPGENGGLYKFARQQGGRLRLVSVLRYKVGGRAPGIESSICIYRNYGFFGDNHGNIICVNLNTMRPVWHYYNHDDSDGTIVCREEQGVPYLYAACEVDKQGFEGISYFVKLRALTGECVWERPVACNRVELPGGKVLDGGMYATPLLGTGDCDTLLFANVCRNGADGSEGELMALRTSDGSVAYTVPYGCFAWSSPVGFLNEHDELFIFTGDSRGRAYLIRGSNGEVLCRRLVGYNFESSPCVVGNSAVVGCRGTNIYKFNIKQKEKKHEEDI